MITATFIVDPLDTSVFRAVAYKGGLAWNGSAYVLWASGSGASFAITPTNPTPGQLNATVPDDADFAILWALTGATLTATDSPAGTWAPESSVTVPSTAAFVDAVEPLVSQILSQLQTDPPTQTGGQQYRKRTIIAGDSYGPTARDFSIVRHRSAEWPDDLSQWTWAFAAAKDADNTNAGSTLVGTVAITVPTGDARALSVTIAGTNTAAAASGLHPYAIVGTRGSDTWTVEAGMASVIARPT